MCKPNDQSRFATFRGHSGGALFLFGLLPCALAAGCELNAPSYVAPAAPLEVGDDGAYATQTVRIEFRAPRDADRERLRELGRARGVQIPWVTRKSVAISIQYVITNLSDRAGTAFVHVDGANQYVRYDSAAIRTALQLALMQNDAPYVPALVRSVPIQVPARGQVRGVVREDEIAEAALDLDAIGRYMAEYQVVLYHDSTRSRTGLDVLPANVELAQLFELTVSLEATQRMRMEFLVRVRDDGNLLADDDDEVFRPNPMDFMPPVPGAMMQ